MAANLGFQGKEKEIAADQMQRLYELFSKTDAVQVEINPLAQTDDGRVMCVDAKIQFDDNASFRQKELFSLHDSSMDDAKEVRAQAANLNYIALDGNIGCLVNGAGLAMAPMDIISHYGGKPANFLDVGGSANVDQVTEAFSILTSDPNVKAILVNIFGGIMRCDVIATGIVQASQRIGLKVPLVVRLEGTNVELGKDILKKSGINVVVADNLDDAANKAVAALPK
jgi:succinyl-CoA synthetase beta subunit